MRQDFRVRLGFKLMALGRELFFQIDVLLDNAIVNDHDLFLATRMRVGIFFVGTTVSCPARMAHPISIVNWPPFPPPFPQLVWGSPLRALGKGGAKHQASRASPELDPVAVDDRDPRRIIARIRAC